MMYGNYGMGLWGILFMVVGGLLLLGLIVMGIVVLAQYLRGPREASGPVDAGQSARHVLSQRYARGEIDENEYTQRLNVLTTTEPRRRSG